MEMLIKNPVNVNYVDYVDLWATLPKIPNIPRTQINIINIYGFFFLEKVKIDCLPHKSQAFSCKNGKC